MTKNQIDRLMRLKNVREVMKRNFDHWSGQLAIENSVEYLEAEIIFLDQVHRSQQEGSPPVTKGKEQSKEQITAEVLWLAGLLFTFADENGNAELKALADLTPTDLKYVRDENFLKLFRTLLKQAEDIGPTALADYGIDNDKLEELAQMLERIEQTIRQPRLTITELKALRSQVLPSFKRARNILMRQLRNLLAPFKLSVPLFWEEFENSIAVIDTGSKPAMEISGDHLPDKI